MTVYIGCGVCLTNGVMRQNLWVKKRLKTSKRDAEKFNSFGKNLDGT